MLYCCIRFIWGEGLIRAFLSIAFEDAGFERKIIIESFSEVDKTIHLQKIRERAGSSIQAMTIFDDSQKNSSAAKALGYQAILVDGSVSLVTLLEHHIDQILALEKKKENSGVVPEKTSASECSCPTDIKKKEY